MIRPRIRTAGFTIIELLTVVAIAAILIAVAAPSFTEFLAKRRVEGTTSELVTDIQFARSEAVSHNAPVRMTFGTDCYVLHSGGVSLSATAVTCTRTSKNLPTGVTEIKTVQLDPGRPVTIEPGTVACFEFEPVRGTTDSGSPCGLGGTVNVRATSGTQWQLRSVLTLMGRVETCLPGSAPYFAGWKPCT